MTESASGTFTDEPRVVPGTIEDLPQLAQLAMDLFSEEQDFEPDHEKQERGLRLILEEPSRGRIFVVRTEHQIIGMVNLLFTISTASGGFVILMEDLVIRPEHRGQGYGTMLVKHVHQFAEKKSFCRITLLTDKISAESQRFFQKNGFHFSHMIPMRLALKGDVTATVSSSPSETRSS